VSALNRIRIRTRLRSLLDINVYIPDRSVTGRTLLEFCCRKLYFKIFPRHDLIPQIVLSSNLEVKSSSVI